MVFISVQHLCTEDPDLFHPFFLKKGASSGTVLSNHYKSHQLIQYELQ